MAISFLSDGGALPSYKRKTAKAATLALPTKTALPIQASTAPSSSFAGGTPVNALGDKTFKSWDWNSDSVGDTMLDFMRSRPDLFQGVANPTRSRVTDTSSLSYNPETGVGPTVNSYGSAADALLKNYQVQRRGVSGTGMEDPRSDIVVDSRTGEVVYSGSPYDYDDPHKQEAVDIASFLAAAFGGYAAAGAAGGAGAAAGAGAGAGTAGLDAAMIDLAAAGGLTPEAFAGIAGLGGAGAGAAGGAMEALAGAGGAGIGELSPLAFASEAAIPGLTATELSALGVAGPALGGLASLPGQAVPPIAGATPETLTSVSPIAGTAAGGSTIDKILGAVSSAGGNILNKAVENPLQTAALLSSIGAIAGAKPSGNPSFDAAGAAAAQGEANRDASWFDAILNRPDMQTPWGSSTWTLREGADPKNPKPGDWVNTVALDEAQQGLLDSDNALKQGYTDTASGMLGRVQDTLGQPFDLSSLIDLPDFSSINTDADRARIEEALLARLNPELEREDERARTRLLNTGFEYGSEGSNIELDRLGRQRNDARLAAIIQAGTEARGVADTQRANMQAQLQGRQQDFSEQSYLRGLPLNELNALRAGSQVQAPEFQSIVPTNTAASPELDALLAKLGLSQSNSTNQQAGFNALLQSLAGLGSAWLGGKP